MKKIYSILIFVLAFLFTFVKVRSFDLFFYLKIAEIESFFSPLKVNLFSYSHPDFPYKNYSFLYSELAYFITNNLGFNGLIVFQSLIIAISFFILLRSADYNRSVITLFIIFLLSLFTLRYRLLFRPHNLSYIFFAINLFLLSRLPKNYLAYLFLNQVLWVNTHNGFILGIINPILLFPFLRGKVNFLKILLTLVAGSFISPNLHKPFLEVINPFLGTTKNIFEYIKVHEWQPIDERLYLSFYGLLVITTLIILIFEKKWYLLPLYLFYLVISFRFVRFVDLFALLSFYSVIAPSGNSYLLHKKPLSTEISKVFYYFQIIFLIILSISSIKDYFKNYLIPYGYGLAEYFYPSNAVDYLKKRQIKGNIFNNYAFGGYIIYKLYPDFKPVIDGRLCYPIDFVKLYADSHENEESFNKIVNLYRPDIFFIDFEHPKLASFVTKLKDNYALTYFDDTLMVFLDREKFKDIVKKDEYKFLKPLYVTGYSDDNELDIKNVKNELEKKLKESPTNRANIIYANLLLREGNINASREIYEKIIITNTPVGKAEAYNNLGVIEISNKNFNTAKKFFKEALYFNPNLSFTHLNLAEIYDLEKSYFLAYYHYIKFIKNSEDEIPNDVFERVNFLKKYIYLELVRILIIFFALLGILIIVVRRVKLNRKISDSNK